MAHDARVPLDDLDDGLEGDIGEEGFGSDVTNLFTGVDVEDDLAPTVQWVFPIIRPKVRADCASVPRPCPFVSCRYHLYLDVAEDGSLRIAFPGLEPDQLAVSCALDLAEDGPRTLHEVGAILNVVKERARQLEAAALRKVRRSIRPGDLF